MLGPFATTASIGGATMCYFLNNKGTFVPKKILWDKLRLGKGPFKPLMFSPRSGYALNIFFGPFKYKIMFFCIFGPSLNIC